MFKAKDIKQVRHKSRATCYDYVDTFLAVENIMYSVFIEEWEVKILAKYVRNVVHVLCL